MITVYVSLNTRSSQAVTVSVMTIEVTCGYGNSEVVTWEKDPNSPDDFTFVSLTNGGKTHKSLPEAAFNKLSIVDTQISVRSHPLNSKAAANYYYGIGVKSTSDQTIYYSPYRGSGSDDEGDGSLGDGGCPVIQNR
ncbi:MAG: hypothetical protein ACREHG_07750 [Candidatus Saccharimonadales bacterium]